MLLILNTCRTKKIRNLACFTNNYVGFFAPVWLSKLWEAQMKMSIYERWTRE